MCDNSVAFANGVSCDRFSSKPRKVHPIHCYAGPNNLIKRARHSHLLPTDVDLDLEDLDLRPVVRRLHLVVHALETVAQGVELLRPIPLVELGHVRDGLRPPNVAPLLRIPVVPHVELFRALAEAELSEPGHVVLQLLEVPDRVRDRHLRPVDADLGGRVRHRHAGLECEQALLRGGDLLAHRVEAPRRLAAVVEADRVGAASLQLAELPLGPLDRAQGLANRHRHHRHVLLRTTSNHRTPYSVHVVLTLLLPCLDRVQESRRGLLDRRQQLSCLKERYPSSQAAQNNRCISASYEDPMYEAHRKARTADGR